MLRRSREGSETVLLAPAALVSSAPPTSPEHPVIKSTVLPALHTWNRFQPDRGIDFNGFLWAREAGGVLIDPMELDADGVAAVRELGGAAWILVTNADHLRAAPTQKGLFGAKVLAPEAERATIGAAAGVVDHWFEPGGPGTPGENGLPGGLDQEIDVHLLAGGKSPGEVALYLHGPEALLFGDAVRSHVSGALRLLPDPKITDRAALVESLRPLAEHPARGILLGDGDSFFQHGAATYRAFLEELG